MRLTIDIDGLVKRGDIVQTNVGDRRERTCIVLRVRWTRPGRYMIWAERWWQVEPELRMSLYRSAERNGGQQTVAFIRYRNAKTRRTFEQYIQRKAAA